MTVVNICSSPYELLQSIGKETILEEFKEFFLKKYMTIDDVQDLQKGIFTSKLKRFTYESVLYNIDKYLSRYLVSLTNIKKIFLPQLLDKTHSTFYLGVSDDGIITGIPMTKNTLNYLQSDLLQLLEKHYQDIIGLHKHQRTGNMNPLVINGTIYYQYEKLINILKNHTIINIHVLQNNKSENLTCQKLLQTIDNTIREQDSYLDKLKKHKELKRIKREYNDRYSSGFQKLIRSDVMIEFAKYTSISARQLTMLLEILKKKIQNHSDVEKHLQNGSYIIGSLFPDDEEQDRYYGSLLNIFLLEYKEFKNIQLSKNIEVGKYSLKQPIRKIKPLLNNISCFNQYLDEIYCMIEIRIPFIKDIKAFIALRKNEKMCILERDFNKDEQGPYTNEIC